MTEIRKPVDQWREICECIADNRCPLCDLDPDCESFDTILELSHHDIDVGVCPNCLTEFLGVCKTEGVIDTVFVTLDDGTTFEWKAE